MRALHGAFLALGALATVTQVLLLRELMVALAGDETALGVGLASWLAGIAVGAQVARRGLRGREAVASAAGLGLLALQAPFGIVAGRVLRWVLAPGAGELPGLGLAVVLGLATLAPAGVLVGWTFTALAQVASRAWSAGEGLTRVYVVEALGSLAGGIVVTFLIVPRLGPIVGASLAGSAALALALPAARGGLLAGGRSLTVLVVGLLALMGFAEPLELETERLRFAGTAPGVPLLSFTETPYQHLVLGGDEIRHIYASGQYTGSFPDPYGSESLAHRLACLAPRPERILAFAGLERGPLRFLLRHPVGQVDLVEPDQAALEFLRTRLPAEDQAALQDPRVKVIHDDPRRFLSRSRDSYDLVLLLEPDPLTLLRARLTTVEFYRMCRARMAPKGVLVVTVKTAPNVLTGETAALGGALFRALGEVFPVVKATPGPDSLFVAGTSPEVVTLEPTQLAARWATRGLASDVFAGELFPLLFPPERVRAQETALRAAAGKLSASRDDRPVSFLHAMARHQQVTRSWLGRGLGAATRLPPSVLVALVLLPSLLLLGRQLHRRWNGLEGASAAATQHAVAVLGAAGMTWSLLILFVFQTRVGVLYGELGLLIALFMLGLAAGGHATRRAALAADVEPGATPRAGRWLLLAIGAALAFGLVLPAALRAARAAAEWGSLPGTAAFGVLLLVAGLVTGGLFPVAAGTLLLEGDGAGEAAGRLEAADHAGACVAAMLGPVLLVPVLGLGATAWLVALLLGLAAAASALAPDAAESRARDSHPSS
jgi:spermidine synthase